MINMKKNTNDPFEPNLPNPNVFNYVLTELHEGDILIQRDDGTYVNSPGPLASLASGITVKGVKICYIDEELF